MLVRQFRVMGAASAIVLVLALGASSAVAAPEGEFAPFAQCPYEVPTVTGCVAIREESGEITIGKLKAPLVKPQVLQAGFFEEGTSLALVGAANGETLPRTPQEIPAGSLACQKPHVGRFDGHVRWSDWTEYGLCKAIFENRRAGVYMTPELAAPASSIKLSLIAAFSQQGTVYSLPLKIRLESPFLGSKCYIGSDSNPVRIDLTNGTAGPLTGQRGELSFTPDGLVVIITGVTFVNDTFAAPVATGCGWGGRLDSLVNTVLGLPSPSGMNTAVLGGTYEQVGSEVVKENS